MSQGVVGGNGAVGDDLHPQALAGRTAFGNGGFVDGEVDPGHGHEHGIDLEQIDGTGFFVVTIHRAIANAALDVHFQLEAVAVGHGGDRTIGVHHLHLRGELKISGLHFSGTSHHETTDLEFGRTAVDGELLAVQQDVENVFTDPRNRGVFVIDTGNPDGGDSTAFQPTHQHAAQRVAQGRGLATLEGTDQENAGLGAILGHLMLNAINLVLQHGLNRGKGRNRTEISSVQTRRRLGRRQPLWGRGVTSRIRVISRPATWRARMAVSRPEPGPLTSTSI